MRFLHSLLALVGLASSSHPRPFNLVEAPGALKPDLQFRPRRCRPRAISKLGKYEANERRQAEGAKGHRTRAAKLALWSDRCREINAERLAI